MTTEARKHSRGLAALAVLVALARAVPDPGRRAVEGGAHADGDRHVLVVDRATCKLFEL